MRYKSRPPTYTSWAGMLQRCYNENHPAYKDYGGRGIIVCAQWRGKGGFERFLKDMGKRPKGKSLDREYNNGNYTPNNCKWSTSKEQNNNRRKPLTVNGWATKLNIPFVRAIRRLKGVLGGHRTAKLFGISPAYVYRIWDKKHWKGVK